MMQFTLMRNPTILQGPSPDVYVKFYGFLPERARWVLFYHGKRIGVFARQEKINGDHYKEDKSDYKIINWLLLVGEVINSETPSYRFQNIEEQNEILGVLEDAFACYGGGFLGPKHGIEVRLHNVLQARIAQTAIDTIMNSIQQGQTVGLDVFESYLQTLSAGFECSADIGFVRNIPI